MSMLFVDFGYFFKKIPSRAHISLYISLYKKRIKYQKLENHLKVYEIESRFR